MWSDLRREARQVPVTCQEANEFFHLMNRRAAAPACSINTVTRRACPHHNNRGVLVRLGAGGRPAGCSTQGSHRLSPLLGAHFSLGLLSFVQLEPTGLNSEPKVNGGEAGEGNGGGF